MTNTILMALAPVFFVMALGYGAGRWGVVNNQKVASLNALVMDFALPASLFVATASAPRAELVAQLPLFAVLGVVMLTLYIVSYAFQRRYSNASPADSSLQALTIAFPNLAGVGLPIVAAVIGPAGTVQLAVALAAGSILISPIALVTLELNRGKEDLGRSKFNKVLTAFRNALTKPVVIAPVIGILISLFNGSLNPVLEACLQLIAHSAAGVALFLTGLILSSQTFKLNGKLIAATGMADIARPLLAAAVVYLFQIPSEAARVAILMAAVPSGFFGILFAVNYRLDSATTGSMVIASTVFSIATLATAILVLFPH